MSLPPPPQLRLKLGDMWDLSYPTKRHIYPLPLSCPLRAYLSVAPAHSDISVGSTYPLCSTSPSRCLGSTPCYSPHKSVGTRSGVVPGASVDGLASWAVGAPRADCLAVPEKEGQRVSADLRSQSSQAAFPHSQKRHCDNTCAFPHTRIDERASIPPTARAMSADTHHTHMMSVRPSRRRHRNRWRS